MQRQGRDTVGSPATCVPARYREAMSPDDPQDNAFRELVALTEELGLYDQPPATA